MIRYRAVHTYFTNYADVSVEQRETFYQSLYEEISLCNESWPSCKIRVDHDLREITVSYVNDLVASGCMTELYARLKQFDWIKLEARFS